MKREVLITALTLVSAGGCADPPAFSAEDEAEIRAMVAEWDRAFASGEADAVAQLLSEDYVDLHAEPVVGEDARTMIASAVGFFTEVNTTVERIEGDGDLAYVWASIDHRFEDDGQEYARVGSGLLIVSRDSFEHWKFEVMSWHTEVQEVDGSTIR